MSVLSGGLVYEYTQESDEYGLVAINSSKEVTLMQDCMYKPMNSSSGIQPEVPVKHVADISQTNS